MHRLNPTHQISNAYLLSLHEDLQADRSPPTEETKTFKVEILSFPCPLSRRVFELFLVVLTKQNQLISIKSPLLESYEDATQIAASLSEDFSLNTHPTFSPEPIIFTLCNIGSSYYLLKLHFSKASIVSSIHFSREPDVVLRQEDHFFFVRTVGKLLESWGALFIDQVLKVPRIFFGITPHYPLEIPYLAPFHKQVSRICRIQDYFIGLTVRGGRVDKILTAPLKNKQQVLSRIKKMPLSYIKRLYPPEETIFYPSADAHGVCFLGFSPKGLIGRVSYFEKENELLPLTSKEDLLPLERTSIVFADKQLSLRHFSHFPSAHLEKGNLIPHRVESIQMCGYLFSVLQGGSFLLQILSLPLELDKTIEKPLAQPEKPLVFLAFDGSFFLPVMFDPASQEIVPIRKYQNRERTIAETHCKKIADKLKTLSYVEEILRGCSPS